MGQYICLGIVILGQTQPINIPYRLFKEAARPADLVGAYANKQSYFLGPIAARRIGSAFLRAGDQSGIPPLGPTDGVREGFIVRRSVLKETREYYYTNDGTTRLAGHTGNIFDYTLEDVFEIHILPWPPPPLSYFYHGRATINKLYFRYDDTPVSFTVQGTAHTAHVTVTSHKLTYIEDGDYSTDLVTLIGTRATGQVATDTTQNRS